ncbi:unnamed protein product [Cladocopium goreaui]|uniref:Ankyrin-1 n=1 Tax=Cladocopium goreaui TaxID=2562237 RepID=A0A9P1GMX1_9DINO|nr:unnamed protein product [Cladocopium goreaui]
MLQGAMSVEDAKSLETLRGLSDINCEEGKKVIDDLESRHGPAFWQNGMENLTDDEFTAKVVAGGRAHALRLVGKTWRAHVYKQHRLQVAYIQEYFLVRANVVKAELCQLQQLFGSSDAAALPRGDGQLTPWQIFFSHIWRQAVVQVVDLAGGPGCCAAGACSFFHEWLGVNKESSKARKIEATILDPVSEWAWCSEKLGFNFRRSASMSDMILEDCTFSADVVLIGWAMNFASKLFWQRLREAFRQRVAALPSCNPYALVLVVDRNPHALHFRDRREEVLQKAEVIQRDHGKNVTYAFLLGSEAGSGSSDFGDAPEE